MSENPVSSTAKPGAPTGYVIIRKAVTAKKVKVAQVEKPKKGKK